MLVLNNIFAGSAQIAVKRVTGSSLVTYNDFWNNGTDHVDSNVNAATTLHENPLFGQNFTLRPVSPCIDAGAVSVVWNGATVTAPAYAGAAPDLGVYEGAGIVAVPGAPQAGGLSLEGVRPNPSRNGFTVAFTLSDTSPARLEVIDLQGRCIVTRELTGLTGVSRVVVLPETRGLPSGVYLVKLIQGREFRTARCMVVR
jgi:hypothetical protein